MSVYAGQTGSALSLKGCFTPEKGADAVLEHRSRCVSESPCFFNAGAWVITTLLFIIQSIPTLSFVIRVSRRKAARTMTPLYRGMTSPARDHVNLGNCHMRHIFYGIPSSWDMDAHSKSEIQHRICVGILSASRLPSKIRWCQQKWPSIFMLSRKDQRRLPACLLLLSMATAVHSGEARTIVAGQWVMAMIIPELLMCWELAQMMAWLNYMCDGNTSARLPQSEEGYFCVHQFKRVRAT